MTTKGSHPSARNPDGSGRAGASRKGCCFVGGRSGTGCERGGGSALERDEREVQADRDGGGGSEKLRGQEGHRVLLGHDRSRQYGEGIILKKGGHRFGVFSVTAPTTVRAIEKQVAYFVKYKVDFIVAITPDKATSTTPPASTS